METRQLQYFLVVAEELHFGRAAQRLHIVQSAVSQQVRRLERELGVTLFDRTTRTVRLTKAGDRLVPHATAVLEAQRRAREAMAQLGAPRPLPVRLGTSQGLAERLDVVLPAFAERTEARLELVDLGTEERLRAVREGELDAALVRGRRTLAGLRLFPVWRDELLVALPAAHPLAGAETVEFAALAELPLRIAEHGRNPALYELVLDCCRTAGFEPRLGRAFTTAQDTLADIGFGGPAWTVFYAAHAKQIAAAGVVFRPLRAPRPRMPTALAVQAGAGRPELSALVEACRLAAGPDGMGD
ncbi:LysR family transcriptional regulator [Sciscionella sediminilitoris]|uniref:LysR family transcriptional regulator n=1 Tax=Sciscionella sediminilitoris TaxID=1445613 RepID=UPI0004DFC3CF|nr:LysR family transcriptional regulator [Sciscionella sp. SE31]